MLETVLVVGMITALAVIGVLNLAGRRGQTEFDSAVRQITALLRDAQVRSVAQASDQGWGVHFENSTTTPAFYALFFGTYSATTTVGYYRLPASVAYDSASLAPGASREVTFAQITGAASTSTSVTVYLVTRPAVSSTIAVSLSGAVNY
jgi:type II secretory pathway pseudopilin PulG